jgi:hypothetical protein
MTLLLLGSLAELDWLQIGRGAMKGEGASERRPAPAPPMALSADFSLREVRRIREVSSDGRRLWGVVSQVEAVSEQSAGTSRDR